MSANESRNVVDRHHRVCVAQPGDRGDNVASVQQLLRAKSSDALAGNRVECSPSPRRSFRQRDTAPWDFVKSIT